MQRYFDALTRLVRPVRAADLPTALTSMQNLLRSMGKPPTFPSIVVAGSVGKGTACHQIAASLHAAGKRVGLFTSPHVHLFRERFLVNGRMIEPESFVQGVNVVLDEAAPSGLSPSTFEAATALALWWFGREHVDIAVLEVGIGGRYDAVNAVRHEIAVITPIEWEHAAMLGGTLESIAWHKAGIIPRNGLIVTAPQSASVMDVIEQEAAAQSAQLIVAPFDQLALSLSDTADFTLESVALPARLEVVQYGGRQIVIDGGHTAGAAARLSAWIDQHHESESVTLIVGMMSDKDIRAYLAPFDRATVGMIYTQAGGSRSLSPDGLAGRFTPTNAQVRSIASVDSALKFALEGDSALIVVSGSFRVAALGRETLGLLSADALDESRRTRVIFEGDDYLKRLI